MTKFKNTYQQFLKYLKDQFSNIERHSFEKSVQKDAFELEALEGFETLNSTDLEKDMSLLKKQLQSKVTVEGKPSLFYKLGIAAFALLLLGVGGIFLNREKENSNSVVYEINKEELPSVKLKKQKDSIHSEIVFDEVVNEVEGLNFNDSLPVKKETNTAKIDETTTSKPIPKANSSNIDVIEETVFEEVEIDRTSKLDDTSNLNATDDKKGRITKEPSLSNTNKIIKGIVSVEESPLPGVNVKIKGKEVGVVSDFDGKYSIKAKSGDTLEFSGVGFKTQEVLAYNNLKIDLEEDITLLDEIVVSNNNTKRRRKGAPPYETNSKQEKTTSEEKLNIRGQKFKRRKVKVSRSKKESRKKGSTTKTETKESNSTKESPDDNMDDFARWLNLELNSLLFEPGKIYTVEVSFKINDLDELDQIRFHTANGIRIQNELRRALKSIPRWALDSVKDKDYKDGINIIFEIVF